jgi:hypothetical protein
MILEPGHLTLEQLQAIHTARTPLEIDETARSWIRASADLVQRAAQGERPVYGVNTGFGKLASRSISREQVDALQLNLVRSHCAGVGEPLAPAIVRLMLALKAASLARGYSGVREQVVDALIAVHNAGLIPHVPSQGSVGASGDLAPLAHMALALIGEGYMWADGERKEALPLLQAAGIDPLVLQAKEGLALLNGTQTSTALALHALFTFEPVLESALVIGAMTVDAARGSDDPFDPRIHELRGQPGQIDVAKYYRALLAGSQIRRSHLEGDDRVQDPYCLRCQPQVVGACLDQLRHAADVLLREANAVTDNPLVFVADDALVSDGRCLRSGDRRGRRDRRTAHRDADRQRGLAPAALSDRRGRTAFGLHGSSRYRGRPGEREQIAGAPGERRLAADLGQPGGSRFNGLLRGAPSASDDFQHGPYPRHRAAGGCAGYRVSQAVAHLVRAGAGARTGARRVPAAASGPPAGRRHRAGNRPCDRRRVVARVSHTAEPGSALASGVSGTASAAVEAATSETPR